MSSCNVSYYHYEWSGLLEFEPTLTEVTQDVHHDIGWYVVYTILQGFWELSLCPPRCCWLSFGLFHFLCIGFFPGLSWLLIFFFHLLELELSSAPKENLSRIHFTLKKQKEWKRQQLRMKNIRTIKRGVCSVIIMKFHTLLHVTCSIQNDYW